MEQFRQIGEALGSLKALMMFRDNIQINNQQCCLLLDIFNFAFESIAEEMKENLRFEEKDVKWKILEQPLKEVHRVFKEGEAYIKQCQETKDWWVKAISLYQNRDCVEFYIHNLLCSIAIAIEAIEMAGESTGNDEGEWKKRRRAYSIKYGKESRDPQIFQCLYGKQYLVSQEFCNRFENAWKEDRWLLHKKIQEKKSSTKQEKRLADLLLKNLDSSTSELCKGKILTSSVLLGSKDYQVRRRLGSGSQYKEIQWLGESFAMRRILAKNNELLLPEISTRLSISHPNILQYFCGFTDEDKEECFLVMELMSRDLSSYVKETSGTRKRVLFTLPVAVDLMLQVARGMEYLHSNKIYHGDLNPSNIFVKSRGVSSEGYLHVKISGFGLSSVRNPTQKSNNNGSLPFIWNAPEVLQEQEQAGITVNTKYTEKADVYSFGMICFELLTGKVPFEDSHLQGDKMSRNIRAGERPLFPFHSPKYVTNLTKRCWHTDPNQRPSFSSICRILRYIKRFLVMNPDGDLQPESMPLMDYYDAELKLVRKFPSWVTSDALSVLKIPFQMFAYRVMEKERARSSLNESSELGSDKASIYEDENTASLDSLPTPSPSQRPSRAEKKCLSSPEAFIKRLSTPKKSLDFRPAKLQGTRKGRPVRPTQIIPCGRSSRMNSTSHLQRIHRAS